MAPLFLHAIDGPRATITLARPESHNIISAEDLPNLVAILDEIAANKAVRAVLLTAAKANVFSSGFDVTSITRTDWGLNELEHAIDRLEGLPQPTVCALTGAVYGGATDLALACDFRIGVAGMRLWVPAAQLGVHYHINGLRRFVERLGPGIAKRIFLLGEEFEADALLACGYLDGLVDPEKLDTTAAAWLDRLTGGAPLALTGMKQAINGVARGDLDEPDARETMLACLRSADVAEGAAAFAEKRKPKFKGL
jgi:enoyl-CoA hydratase